MNTTNSLDTLLLHADWTHALARRLVADPGFAADAAQETLLRAVRTQPNVASPRAWLGRVLRNVVRDERRRKQPEALGNLEPTSELVQRAESHERVVSAILELAEVHRDVLLERYFEGRTPKKIARREGVAVQTISNRLTKAHAALRAKLEREGGQEWLAGIAPLLRVEAAPLGVLATSLVFAACVVAIGGGAWWISTRSSVSNYEPVVAVSNAGPMREAAAATIKASPSIDDRQSTRSPVVFVETSEQTSLAPQPTGSIAGTVLDVTGEPYRNILLALQSDEAEHEVRTDSSGHYRLKGVAANSAVTLTVEFAGGEKHEENLRLEPATLLKHDIVLANVTRIEGRFIDAEEKGIPSRRVVLAQAVWRGSEFFSRNARRDGRVAAEVETDKHGDFAIDLVPPGEYIIGVEPLRDVNGLFTPFTKPLFRPHFVPAGTLVQQVELLESKKYTIRGRLETSDGRPVDDVILLAVLNGVAGALRADSYDGMFQFDGIPDGEYTIITNGTPEGLGQGEARGVRAGTDDILIVLDPGGILAMEVFDPRGTLTDGWCSPLPERSNPGRPRSSSASLRAGELQTQRFESVSPAIYCLTAWSDVDGLYGFVPGVEVGAGEDLGAIRVRLEPSAWLDLKHNGQAEMARIRVYRGDSLLRSSWILRGKTKRTAVPPGQLEVHLIDGDLTTKHDIWIDAGQAAELAVSDKR